MDKNQMLFPGMDEPKSPEKPSGGLIICPLTHGRTPPFSGVLIGKCADCGQPIFVSPSSWLILHDHPTAKLICGDCACAPGRGWKIIGGCALKFPHMVIQPMTPGQQAEAEDIE